MDVFEGVKMHTLLEIDGIKDLYPIPGLHKCVPDLANERSFWVCFVKTKMVSVANNYSSKSSLLLGSISRYDSSV